MKELVIGDKEQNLYPVRFLREARGRSILEGRNALEGIEAASLAGRKGKAS